MTDEKALDNYECEGQMSFSDYLPETSDSPNLIAVSKIFARAIKQMNLAEWKTFVLALTKLHFTEKNGNIIYLDKQKLAELLNMQSDTDHLSENLNRSIGKLPQNSFIQISDKDKDIYESGVFVTRITMLKNRVKIKFEEDYMPLFQELNKSEKGYITMWADDLFQMTSDRSILLYEDMRLHSDTRVTNSKIYTTKDLKELFGMPKDGKGSYMKSNGHFDRTNFEKKVLGPVCDDLLKCNMVGLQINPDGSVWEKVKRHGYVVGYKFSWIISNHPEVATAKDKKKLMDDIDKNPQIMKVAKDIAKGTAKQKSSFDFTETNDYDYDAIAKAMLNRTSF